MRVDINIIFILEETKMKTRNNINEAIKYLKENANDLGFTVISIVTSYDPDKMYDAYMESIIMNAYRNELLKAFGHGF